MRATRGLSTPMARSSAACAKTSCGVPSSATRPSFMTRSRSQNSERSATFCSMTITVMPRSRLRSRSTSKTMRELTGSRGGRGLVEHEHARGEREYRRDGDLLLLAAGERGDLAVAEVGDTHGIERRRDGLVDALVRHAEVLEAEEQLVLNHRGDHLRVDVLVDRAHDPRDVGERELAGVLPLDERRAKELSGEVVRDGTGEHGGERRLAGARGADDARERAGGDGERDAVERPVGVLPIGERDVAHLDDRLFGGLHGVLSRGSGVAGGTCRDGHLTREPRTGGRGAQVLVDGAARTGRACARC